MLFFKN